MGTPVVSARDTPPVFQPCEHVSMPDGVSHMDASRKSAIFSFDKGAPEICRQVLTGPEARVYAADMALQTGMG